MRFRIALCCGNAFGKNLKFSSSCGTGRVLTVFALSALFLLTSSSLVLADGEAPSPTPEVAQALNLEEESTAAIQAAEESWEIIGKLLKRRMQIRDLEELRIIDAQIDLRVGALKKNLGAVFEIIGELEAEGHSAEKARKAVKRILDLARQLLWKNLRRYEEAVERQRERVRNSPKSERLAGERDLSDLSEALNDSCRSLLVLADYRRDLGEDVSRDLKRIDEFLMKRLERVAGELKVHNDELGVISRKIAEAGPGEAKNLKLELPVLEEAHARAVRDLTDLVQLGEKRGLDVDRYKKILIQSTGSASVGMLNRRVAFGLFVDEISKVRNRLLTLIPQLIFRGLVFFSILLSFWVLALLLASLVRKAINRPGAHMPQLLRGTVVSAARNTMLGIGVIVGLSQAGIDIGAILAGMGIAGFIVGFALQDTLSNFAAGAMILVYRPFDVGDAVETAGVLGQVIRVSVVSTTIDTFDNQRHIIPNRMVWGNVITNRTSRKTRRVDLGGRRIIKKKNEKVEEILNEIVSSHPDVLEDPAPIIRLQKITETALEFALRPWAKTGDYWKVYRDLTRSVKIRFDREGIPLPTPRQEILLRRETPSS